MDPLEYIWVRIPGDPPLLLLAGGEHTFRTGSYRAAAGLGTQHASLTLGEYGHKEPAYARTLFLCDLV